MLPFLETKDTDLFVYSFRDFGFPVHFHNSMEVICTLSGEIVLNVDNVRHVVHEGEIAVVFPGRIHSYETDEGKSNSGFLLLLGQRLIGEYSEELKGFAPRKCAVGENEIDPDALRAIRVLRTAAAEDFRLQKAYALLFLCRLMPALTLDKVKCADENILYPLVEYMDKHFREDIHLSDVAAALYMSRTTVSRMISRYLNMNFNDYLNSLRINLAIQLMDTTDKSVTDICFEVGFGNVRTFYRAFEKQCKASPVLFRKRHCEG